MESSPPVTDSPCREVVYSEPGAFLHDLHHGKIPLSAVNMEQYLLAHAWTAVDGGSPKIRAHIMVNGGLYDVHMQVAAVRFPEKGQNLAGGIQ